MFGCSIAFIRMRSPSSAPPDLRRDGSIEMIAIFSLSLLVEPEAADQLVGERALARAAGAGDAERRAPSAFAAAREQLVAQLRRDGVRLRGR